jgi:hypothetical protein
MADLSNGSVQEIFFDEHLTDKNLIRIVRGLGVKPISKEQHRKRSVGAEMLPSWDVLIGTLD